MNEELQKFIEWIPQNIKEMEDKTPDEIVEVLNELGKSDEGKKMLATWMEEFKGSKSMFKDGGKMEALVNRFKCGGKAKIKKGKNGLDTGNKTVPDKKQPESIVERKVVKGTPWNSNDHVRVIEQIIGPEGREEYRSIAETPNGVDTMYYNRLGDRIIDQAAIDLLRKRFGDKFECGGKVRKGEDGLETKPTAAERFGEIKSDDRSAFQKTIDDARTWYKTTPFFNSAVWDALTTTAATAAGGAAISKIAKLAKSAYLARAAKLTNEAAQKASDVATLRGAAPGQVWFSEIGRYATPDDAYYAHRAAQAVGKAGVEHINNMLSSTSRIFK